MNTNLQIFFLSAGLLLAAGLAAAWGWAELRLRRLKNEYLALRQRQTALQEEAARAQSLFDESPLSLWEEDLSAVKERLDGLRANGVQDLAAFLDQRPDVVQECAGLARVLDVNKAALRMFCADSKEEMYRNLSTIFPEEAAPQFKLELLAMAAGMPHYAGEILNRTLDGKVISIRLEWAAVPGHEADLSKVIVSMIDITAQKEMEKALRESEMRYRSLFEDSPISLWEEDLSAVRQFFNNLRAEGVRDFRTYLKEHPEDMMKAIQMVRIVDVNNATLKLYQAPNRDVFLAGLGSISGKNTLNPAIEVFVTVAEGLRASQMETINYTLTGEERNILMSWIVAPGFEESYGKVIVSILDITERKQLQEELLRQASTDMLTGAYNRRHFMDMAYKEIQRSRRTNRSLAAAMLDIDYFKVINDTFGHSVGDQFLQILTEVTLLNIRKMDVFARLGGDEFVILLSETRLEQAVEVIERIRQSLASRFLSVGQKPISITISVGIAGFHPSDESIEAVLERADRGLYRAKQNGRNRVEVELPRPVIISPDSGG